MGSRPERGAYGNARGKPAKQKQRREARLSTPRVAAALEEARQQNAVIDALAAAEPAVGRPALVYVRPEPEPASVAHSPATDAPEPAPTTRRRRAPRPARPVTVSWTLADAYRFLDAGYTCEYVAKRTGYDLDIIQQLREENADVLLEQERSLGHRGRGTQARDLRPVHAEPGADGSDAAGSPVPGHSGHVPAASEARLASIWDVNWVWWR